MRLQLLIAQHIQHRQARRACDRIAAKGAEEFHPVVKCIGDLGRRDYCREREAIPDRLA